MNYYIGIDVSKQSLKMFDGVNEYEVPNEKSLKTFKKLLKKKYVKEWTYVKLIYEPTSSYSNYLHEFAFKYGLKVYEVNPKKSSNFTKALGNRSKTDSIDAKMLYRFSILLREEDYSVPEIDRITEELGSYISSYKIIQKAKIMLSNHLKSEEYVKRTDSKFENFIDREVEKFKEMENSLEKEISSFIERTPSIKEDIENLLSIKGIGIISAVVLLYMFRKYPETNREEITALFGLDPISKDSGFSIHRKKRISKQGNPLPRTILYFPTIGATRCNEQIKIFYKRLIKNHKPPKYAIIACMRKLILIAHHIYVNKEKYNPLYEEEKNYSFCY